MQVFFFKININSKAAEFSCEHQSVNGISPEAGYALGYDGINFPGSAVLNQPKKVGAVSCSCAGSTSVGISVGQLTTGVTIPEWTAVLMLSNMESPALYMQAAFRAQNPCLFTDAEGNSYRKQNAYVFDFDPARTLTIFEQFANDLIPETSGDKGDFDSRKRHVRELLNFFPVYGEDDEGSMIELDAEKVLTIPRHIHAKEVVERGFMSNFLFANISGIFGAPKEIIDIINNMQAIEEPKALSPTGVDETTADSLHLNDDREVEIPMEQVIGTASELFGDKVYADVGNQLDVAVEELQRRAETTPNPKRDELGEAENVKDRLVQHIHDYQSEKEKYYWNTAVIFIGRDLNKALIRYLENRFVEIARNCKRYSVLTKNTYRNTVIKESQKAVMEEFVDNVKILINALGYKVLEPLLQTNGEMLGVDDEKLFITAGGVSATGIVTAEGFVVFKGSTVNQKTSSKSLSPGLKKLRDKLFAEGKVDNLVTTENILFSSSSAAADFVLGYSVSGPRTWKRTDGLTLREIEEKETTD